MRVRVMQNNVFIDTFSNMGANATPMAFGEVFSALETRAIDAQENPVVTIDTSKFYEVQDYLSVTRHAYTPFLVLYSKPLWDRLSAEEQAALRECAVEGQKVQRAAVREQTNTSLQNVTEAGMGGERARPGGGRPDARKGRRGLRAARRGDRPGRRGGASGGAGAHPRRVRRPPGRPEPPPGRDPAGLRVLEPAASPLGAREMSGTPPAPPALRTPPPAAAAAALARPDA
jgi:hypothetical protein